MLTSVTLATPILRDRVLKLKLNSRTAHPQLLSLLLVKNNEDAPFFLLRSLLD